ncbi:MAG TPA: phosphoribosylglycinamide formyltransferase [Alphaproteobacteria bacterium]|nr:phosphoribosylglycinamide formyltransferase [Alphaproteobacteria bacterium]
MTRKRVAILISGRGSNMRALIEAARAPGYPAEIVLVISNVPDAAGLDDARAEGVAATVIDHRDFADRPSFENAIETQLRTAKIDLVCLAGFMRLLTAEFVGAWRDRILNIHPSLLPAFRGLDTHARALAAGVRFSGCTVHFVRAEMDAGPIIAQAVVPVRPDDDAARLAARVLSAEHQAYRTALALVASGRAQVEAERVIVADAVWPQSILLNPAE